MARRAGPEWLWFLLYWENHSRAAADLKPIIAGKHKGVTVAPGGKEYTLPLLSAVFRR